MVCSPGLTTRSTTASGLMVNSTARVSTLTRMGKSGRAYGSMAKDPSGSIDWDELETYNALT